VIVPGETVVDIVLLSGVVISCPFLGSLGNSPNKETCVLDDVPVGAPGKAAEMVALNDASFHKNHRASAPI